MSITNYLLEQTRRLPLIAILRDLQISDAAEIGAALYASGFRTLEVPLNRPDALACIEILVRTLPGDCLVGGGTMLTVLDVDAVHAVGGRLMVAPNCDARVIARGVEHGMLCAPGVMTPTEAITALQAGAHALKIFPADALDYGGFNALKSVLPDGTDMWPVGGIGLENIAAWKRAGATGFGIGSQLYTAGTSANAIAATALRFVQAWVNT